MANIYFGLLENLVFINKNNVMKVILFFILCYKISPIIFSITIIFCRHVTNVTSPYKISPIIFTITIFFADMLQTLVTLHHVTRSPPYWVVERLSVQ